MKKKQSLFLKYERTRKILKTIVMNSTLPHQLREKAQTELNQLPRDTSIVRHKNLCILTGRSKSLFSGYKLSRLMLQKLSRDGMLTGFRKSS
nr:30S ribosomal protein S14 [Nannochloropsis oculata]